MPNLYFNSQAAFEDLKRRISDIADDILDEYFAEINNRMQTFKGRNDLEKYKENVGNVFKRSVIGYADAIIDSYGTGSLLDTSNEALSSYKSSALWNPLRLGNQIVGRRKGTYRNIYGELSYSKGNMAGRPIEHIVKPKAPSYAFQNAWIMYVKGKRIQELITLAVNEWCRNCSKYFEYR